MSFAPLAGRLAAHAAELRPVEGSRDNLAKFMALVMCALLDMLILVCEMLDSRAVVFVPLVAVTVPAQRATRQFRRGGSYLPSPRLAPEVCAVFSQVAAEPSETAEATPAGPWLAWSRDPDVPWCPDPKIRISGLGLRTFILLLNRNKISFLSATRLDTGTAAPL